MTNENDVGSVNDTGIGTQPVDLPSIGPKPGWSTSEGQMTAVFTIVSLIISFLGYHYTPDQIGSYYDLIMHMITVLGPLLVSVPVLGTYIVSRGKTKSNSINATASMNIATLGGFNMGSILGGSVKDPKTYINILKGINSTGLIPGPAGKIIGGVLGSTSGATLDDSEFQSEVTQALQQLDARLKKLEGK